MCGAYQDVKSWVFAVAVPDRRDPGKSARLLRKRVYLRPAFAAVRCFVQLLSAARNPVSSVLGVNRDGKALARNRTALRNGISAVGRDEYPAACSEYDRLAVAAVNVRVKEDYVARHKFRKCAARKRVPCFAVIVTVHSARGVAVTARKNPSFSVRAAFSEAQNPVIRYAVIAVCEYPLPCVAAVHTPVDSRVFSVALLFGSSDPRTRKRVHGFSVLGVDRYIDNAHAVKACAYAAPRFAAVRTAPQSVCVCTREHHV